MGSSRLLRSRKLTPGCEQRRPTMVTGQATVGDSGTSSNQQQLRLHQERGKRKGPRSMCTTICIGRDSLVAGMESQLRSLGYDLKIVGSLHEYLEAGRDLREHIVLVS